MEVIKLTPTAWKKDQTISTKDLTTTSIHSLLGWAGTWVSSSRAPSQQTNFGSTNRERGLVPCVSRLLHASSATLDQIEAPGPRSDQRTWARRKHRPIRSSSMHAYIYMG